MSWICQNCGFQFWLAVQFVGIAVLSLGVGSGSLCSCRRLIFKLRNSCCLEFGSGCSCCLREDTTESGQGHIPPRGLGGTIHLIVVAVSEVG